MNFESNNLDTYQFNAVRNLVLICMASGSCLVIVGILSVEMLVTS